MSFAIINPVFQGLGISSLSHLGKVRKSGIPPAKITTKTKTRKKRKSN